MKNLLQNVLYSCHSIPFIPYLYMAIFFLRKPKEHDG